METSDDKTRDDTLRTMLRTPPKPHKPKSEDEPKRGLKKGPGRPGRSPTKRKRS